MRILTSLLLASASLASAQTPHDIPAARLQSILDSANAVQQRETFKPAVKAALARQSATAYDTCSTVTQQQPYNICMGQAEEQATRDFAVFYNNLQLLCHTQAELTAMQSSQKVWNTYHDAALHSAQAAWPDGSGAPGFAAQIDIQLLRDRMHELAAIFGLNIAQ